MNENGKPAKADRVPSSLVIKLNLRLTGRLVSGFLSLNFLLIIITLTVILWQAEQKAQDIMAAVNQAPGDLVSINLADRNFQVLPAAEPPGGLALPPAVEKYLPAGAKQIRRGIALPKFQERVGLWGKIDAITYNLTFPAQGRSYKIVYSLGAHLKLLTKLLILVLIFEILALIKNVRRGSRSIQNTLRPLSEMAEQARQLNNELYYRGSREGNAQIRDLAGVISDIDASRLDQRLAVGESPNELGDLAEAINGMLNRIGSAYQSQLRFVSDASHELRTPISVIQGYANLLDRWGKKDEKTLQESIEAIKSETESMKDLVEQLLFLARGDNETLQLHRQEFDASEIIEETVAEAKMIDPDHNFALDLHRPCPISADKQLFKQAMRILVDNSIKYSPGGEEIIIRSGPDEGAIRISVQDQGIGIAAQDLPNIFERFYRSDESRARKTGGSGLGLAIARWIVERHGGHFEVLSRLDIGTRITVVLPTSKSAA